jgi:hypothetical protein
MKCSGHSGPWTWKASGTLAVTSPCTPPFELSGADWVNKFPGSSSPDALADPFRTDVINFISAMKNAGITVLPSSTYRPYERSYLMHYSWLIAKKGLSPKAVPPFEPPAGSQNVDICWIHYASDGTYDANASVAAAWAMVNGYHTGGPDLKTAPALQSMHNKRLAIDMSTTWTNNNITIADGSGNNVTINTSPHTGLNKQLMAVGATYGVIHFCYNNTCTGKTPADDAKHWSSNGH